MSICIIRPLSVSGSCLIGPGGVIGGGVAVSDEGTVVNSSACNINFIGADVIAKQDPDEDCQVDVYIPTPSYPSHYNTNDGTTNGIVTNTGTSTRHVANPGSYDIGDWVAGSEHPTTRSSNVYYNTSEVVLFEDTASSVVAEIYGADGATVLASVTISDIAGNTSASQDGVTVSITNWDVSSDKYQAKISVSYDLSSIIPDSGRFSIKISHIQTNATYIKSQNDLFYDSEPNTASLTGVHIVESAARITRYLSGVQYYDLNSPFTVDIDDIDNLNGTSYPTIQTEVFGAEFGLPQLNLQGSDLTDWTNDWDDIDDSYHNEDWKITAVNYRYIGDEANISARTEDWSAGALVNSDNMKILIDTWGPQSSELEEYFTDENFRMMSDYATPWDSTQDLRTYDGGNTGVQVIGGVIKVPSTLSTTNNNNADFSDYNPLSNPDYSSSDGNTYYREFIDVDKQVRGSAWLAISGFTLQDLIDEKILLFIDVPGKFTSECYAHSPEEFNYGEMDGDDDPIRVNDSTDYNIHISFGTYGLDEDHDRFRIRLVIVDDTIEPSSIVVSW